MVFLTLTELLKNNIDLSKIPEILKLALKKLRNLFFNKKDGKDDVSESRLQPEETSGSTSDSQTITEETIESTRCGF